MLNTSGYIITPAELADVMVYFTACLILTDTVLSTLTSCSFPSLSCLPAHLALCTFVYFLQKSLIWSDFSFPYQTNSAYFSLMEPHYVLLSYSQNTYFFFFQYVSRILCITNSSARNINAHIQCSFLIIIINVFLVLFSFSNIMNLWHIILQIQYLLANSGVFDIEGSSYSVFLQ